ncbi:butyrophilin subfamily 3 member A3-like [Xyrichtys novacula]|uniref:Butyrophilin subfamily 3 member A3-like n=1 Tax=Xyrichtys novacula TaxID=13765 RepID=A0AAV1G8Y2_XYRNO|nr:butyrophilin subfamily 3 member A3-like [Xyrichtys novacula]
MQVTRSTLPALLPYPLIALLSDSDRVTPSVTSRNYQTERKAERCLPPLSVIDFLHSSFRMFPLMDRKFLTLPFGAFTDLLFLTVVFLTLIHSCAGQELIGPSRPIVSLIGEDVIFPSYLEPAMNTFDMTVEWSRPDLDPRFVFVWRDGVELGSNKHPSFIGRSLVFIDKLRHGNVSMKLSEVKLSDEGGYRCFIPTLSKDVTVQLLVGAVSSPVLRVTRNNSGVLLECESKGWYPEPEMFLLDAEGNLLSSSPTETIRGPDDLYTVSRKVTVEEKHGKNFSCRVTQKKIHQSRETHTVIPDHFFVVPTTPSTPILPSSSGSPASSSSQPVIIGSVIICAGLVLIPLVVFILWRRRKNKLKNKRDHESGTEQTEEGKTKTSKGDLTEFNVEKEGEEREALMKGGEEENKVDDEREEDNRSQSEPEDQLMTKPESLNEMDRTSGGREIKKSDERKEEIKQVQEMEQEQTVRPVQENSGLQMDLFTADRQRKQPQNLNNQEIERETERDEDNEGEKSEKKRRKKEKKQEQKKKGGSASRGKKKLKDKQREEMKPKEESLTEMEESKKTDETELSQQKEKCVFRDDKHKRDETEFKEKTEKDQERKQPHVSRLKIEREEKLTEQSDEKLRETTKMKDKNKHPSTDEVLEKSDPKLHPDTAERKKGELQGEAGSNETCNGLVMVLVADGQIKRQELETNQNIKNQELKGEKEVQTEKQEEKHDKYQEENKNDLEESTIKIKAVIKNRQEDEFRGDLQTDINETLMETKEKLNQTKEDRGKQAEQQLEVKEKDREKTEESTEEVKVMDEEMMKTEEDNINVTQKKDGGVQNQNERRRRREEAVRRAAERRGTRQHKGADREIREEGKEEGGGGRTEESEEDMDTHENQSETKKTESLFKGAEGEQQIMLQPEIDMEISEEGKEGGEEGQTKESQTEEPMDIE